MMMGRIMNDRELIKYMLDRYGLTKNQLGRLNDVSGRTIANWMAGAPISESHANGLKVICERLEESADGDTPEARRNSLLNTVHGMSKYRRLVIEFANNGETINDPVFDVKSQLGVYD